MAGKAGRSGPPRKPALIREIEGNRSRRPIPKEPKAEGQPAMPDYLNDEQRQLWRALVAQLPKGLLAACDTAFLEAAAMSWWTFREARRQSNASGLLIRDKDGQPKPNPYLKIAKQAAADLNMFGASLGMSPAARARLVAIDDGAVDPMELLLGMDGGMYGELSVQ